MVPIARAREIRQLLGIGTDRTVDRGPLPEPSRAARISLSPVGTVKRPARQTSRTFPHAFRRSAPSRAVSPVRRCGDSCPIREFEATALGRKTPHADERSEQPEHGVRRSPGDRGELVGRTRAILQEVGDTGFGTHTHRLGDPFPCNEVEETPPILGSTCWNARTRRPIVLHAFRACEEDDRTRRACRSRTQR
jgi:hypothetical protein